MKIGIDTLGLEHGQSGLGSYLFYLMENLSQNDSIEYELFGQEADRYTYKAKFDVKYSAVNVSDSVNSQQRWHRWHLNKFVRSQKYDAVIYCAAPRMLPRKSSAKGIAIVNDLVSVFLENKKDKSYSSSGIKNLKKIDKIIVPNEYVKNDLTNLDIDAGKIVIIPNGIDHGIFYQYNLSDSEFVDIKPFAIKRPYIIYPTRISDAEKNHIKLIEAFNTGDITIYYDEELIRELQHYAVEKTAKGYTYNGADGVNDDYVISLALCYDTAKKKNNNNFQIRFV